MFAVLREVYNYWWWSVTRTVRKAYRSLGRMGDQMAWENGGRYYTRSKRVDGRVVREYIGCGVLGVMAAEDDRGEREARRQAVAVRKAARTADVAQEKELIAYCNGVDVLLAQVYNEAGYHNHRGQWRHKRGIKETN